MCTASTSIEQQADNLSKLRARTHARSADILSTSDLAVSGRRRGGRVGTVVGASSPDR